MAPMCLHYPHWRMLTQITILLGLQIKCILAFVTCSDAYQCVGQTIQTDTHVYGWGYKSIFGPFTSITSSDYIRCEGAFSCNSVSHISHSGSNGVTCFGAQSCSNTSIKAELASCPGANSCEHVIFNSTTTIYCLGYRSCANSQFHRTSLINAWGSYSLLNATIYSFNSPNQLQVTFDGYYAGFGAKIVCQQSHFCIINCTVNACYMLYVECFGTCKIFTASKNTIRPVYYYNRQELNFHLLDSSTLSSASTMHNDLLCSAQSTVKFDDFVQHQGGSDIVINNGTGPICCRGTSACQYINKIESITTTKDSIICSGYNSCQHTTNIITNGDVFCSGRWSCRNTNIQTMENVYCIGQLSCHESQISGAQNVYCSFSGCFNSIINSNGNSINIYFIGFASGHNVPIYCNIGDNCFVKCGGKSSCDLTTTLQCDGNCTVDCEPDIDWSACHTNNNTNDSILSPNALPTNDPSALPTIDPSISPNALPTIDPSISPNALPTNDPSFQSDAYSEDEPKKKKSDGILVIILVCAAIVMIILTAIFIMYYCYCRHKYYNQIPNNNDDEPPHRIM